MTGRAAALFLAAMIGISALLPVRSIPLQAAVRGDSIPEGTAEAGTDVPLPQAGEMISGFRAVETGKFALLGADTILFEHEATGARLLYIANRDINRVFDLTFHTRAEDDSGMPAVLKNAVLRGSEKYPSDSLFGELQTGTFNTGMRVTVGQNMTAYACSSLSEEQLLKYADYYTDSCLHPLALKDEAVFRDMLTGAGSVQDEMRASMTQETMAFYNARKAAFPGAYCANIYSGDPFRMPEITREALQAYHDVWYHPSNCVAYLYGSCQDYTAFLKLLDEAFAGYGKRPSASADESYEIVSGFLEVSSPYPVTAAMDPEGRSTVVYEIVIPGIKQEPEVLAAVNTLTDLLNSDASALKQSLRIAFPGSIFSIGADLDGPEAAVNITGMYMKKENADSFKRIVDRTLRVIAEEGFSDTFADNAAFSLAMIMKLVPESPNTGLEMVHQVAQYCAAAGSPYAFMAYMDAINHVRELNGQGVYRDAVKDWLLDESHAVLAVTYPEPDTAAETETAAGPADIEPAVAAVGDAAAAGREAPAGSGTLEDSGAPEESGTPEDSGNGTPAETTESLLAALDAVTVASLPEETRRYAVSDETDAYGVRHLDAEAAVDGLGISLIMLDASDISMEDIHWFSLFCQLMGQLDTPSHSGMELASLKNRYLYALNLSLAFADSYDGPDYTPYLKAQWISDAGDLENGYALIADVLWHSDLTDTEKIRPLLGQYRQNLEMAMMQAPYIPLMYEAMGTVNPSYAYLDHFRYLSLYTFLEEAEKLLAEDPAAFTAKLEQVRSRLRRRQGAISGYAGTPEGIEAHRKIADAFYAELDSEPGEKHAYAFAEPAGRTALIADSRAQYNGIVTDYETFGTGRYTGDLNVMSDLVTDLYLIPQLKEQYGVGAAVHQTLGNDGILLLSQGDPNIRETFAVLEGLPAFLESLSIDQETLDGYILSAYTKLVMPEGELYGAIAAITDRIMERPEDSMTVYIREMKSLTPEKVREYAGCYRNMIDSGYRFSAGSAGAVEAARDLFDQILDPFGSEGNVPADPASAGQAPDGPEPAAEAAEGIGEEGAGRRP